MIGLDTNVLVRFLVEDDAAQSARAAALIDGAVDADDTLFISDIVLCETVWVLSGAYDIRKPEIARTLRDLGRARHLRFEDTARLMRAVAAYEHGRADFADYMIAEHASEAGCDGVATFDRTRQKEDGFFSP